MGTRVGIPGTTQPAAARRVPEASSEAGPRRLLQGAWSGWDAGPGDYMVFGGGDGPCTTLRARSGHPVALPVQDPQNAASGPIWRDLGSFLEILVKTAKCHQNMSKRPVIVPISKTGLKSHLLIF